MCLLLLSYRAHPDVDVLLGGNRDEFLQRPSESPTLIHESPRIWAGRDLEAGGTWIGRNEHGLIAALTNRREPSPTSSGAAPSRGTLVSGLLRHATPQQAAEWLSAQPLGDYRPFNVLFGSTRAFYSLGSGEGAFPIELQPGRYVLSNSTLDDRGWAKVARSHEFLEMTRHLDGESLLTAMQAFLCEPLPAGTHPNGRSPSDSIFVVAPSYGTVSATIMASGGRLGERYHYAEAEAMHIARTPGSGWAAQVDLSRPPQSQSGTPFRAIQVDPREESPRTPPY